MGTPQVSNAFRWQITGMREVDMLLRQIDHQLIQVSQEGHIYLTFCSIVRKYQSTNDVKDRATSAKPCKISFWKDNALKKIW